MTLQDEADAILRRAEGRPERRIGRRQIDREMYDLARAIVAICDSGNVEHARVALMEGSPLVGEARALLAKIDGAK